jgi:hypothetical protein
MKIEQTHYPPLLIDNSEPDIIQVWQNGKEDSNVIQIERDKVFRLCVELQIAWLDKKPDMPKPDKHPTPELRN